MIPTEATASASPIVDLRELRKTYALPPASGSG